MPVKRRGQLYISRFFNNKASKSGVFLAWAGPAQILFFVFHFCLVVPLLCPRAGKKGRMLSANLDNSHNFRP